MTSWAQVEDAALWFTLGLLARPLLRLMLEVHREDVERRRAEAPARMLHALGHLPPPPAPQVEHPHPSRGGGLPPRYLEDQS